MTHLYLGWTHRIFLRLNLLMWLVVGLVGCRSDNCAAPGRHKLTPIEWEVVDTTISSWEEYWHETIPDNCYTLLDNTNIVVVDNQEDWLRELPWACGERALGACPLDTPETNPPYLIGHYNGERILMSCWFWQDTLAHEVVHLLEWCTGRGVDGAHLQPYWGVVAPR